MGGGGEARVGGGGGVSVDVNRELKFCENLKKIFFFRGGGGVRGQVGGFRGGGRGGQGGCERRIEVFCENSKKKFFGGRGRWGGGGEWVGLGGVRVSIVRVARKKQMLRY